MVPSTDIRQFTTTCNSCSIGSDAVFCHLQTLHAYGAHIFTYICMKFLKLSVLGFMRPCFKRNKTKYMNEVKYVSTDVFEFL